MREEATTFVPADGVRGVIVALRDERGSYNQIGNFATFPFIVALRDERGSYNRHRALGSAVRIVALRDERGSYNVDWGGSPVGVL